MNSDHFGDSIGDFAIKLYEGQTVKVELPVTFAGGNRVEWPIANEIEFALNGRKLDKKLLSHLVLVEYASANIHPTIWMSSPDGHNPIRGLRFSSLKGASCKINTYIRGRAETTLVTGILGPNSMPDWLERGLVPE